MRTKALQVTYPALNQKAVIFLLSFEHRNFSKVARLLGLSQPAVSKALSGFEKSLGFELFHRHRKPIEPTAEAILLYEELLKLGGSFSDFLQHVRKEREIKPVLRIGMLESLSITMGTAIIKETNDEVSRIILTTAPANVLYPRLLDRSCDLIFTNRLNVSAPEINRKKLFDEPSVLIFPKGYLKGKKEFSSWEQLSEIDIPPITYWKECGAGQVNDTFLRSKGAFIDERIVIDSNALLCHLVASGIGWAIARPTVLMQNPQTLEKFDIVPTPQPLLMRSIYLMWRNRELSSSIDRITEIAQRTFNETTLPQILKVAPWLTKKDLGL